MESKAINLAEETRARVIGRMTQEREKKETEVENAAKEFAANMKTLWSYFDEEKLKEMWQGNFQQVLRKLQDEGFDVTRNCIMVRGGFWRLRKKEKVTYRIAVPNCK